jgi:hypothetical protein
MFDGVKVFSATMRGDRERLGDRITDWIASNPKVAVTEVVVTQSSDSAFHCITLTMFFRERAMPTR